MVFVRTRSSLLGEARAGAVSIAEKRLADYAAEAGYPVRVHIASRALDADAFDGLADALGVPDAPVAVAAIIPRLSDSVIKGLVLSRIEEIVDAKLESAPIEVIFERVNERRYDHALTAVLAYHPGDHEPGEPVEPVEVGVAALVTRRLRIAELIMGLWTRWRG